MPVLVGLSHIRDPTEGLPTETHQGLGRGYHRGVPCLPWEVGGPETWALGAGAASRGKPGSQWDTGCHPERVFNLGEHSAQQGPGVLAPTGRARQVCLRQVVGACGPVPLGGMAQRMGRGFRLVSLHWGPGGEGRVPGLSMPSLPASPTPWELVCQLSLHTSFPPSPEGGRVQHSG